MLYPIAETFHSIKGEGQWTGTPMKFIRLAGCNVGQVKQITGQPSVGVGLEERRPAWQCHTYDNRPFWCDTDFHKYQELSEEELLADVWEKRIVLTGGEPLIHGRKLQPLIRLAHSKGLLVHLETSGTLSPRDDCGAADEGCYIDWIAVSPKLGYRGDMLEDADEIKLLVDENFDDEQVPSEALRHPRVWLLPIGETRALIQTNINKCFEIQKKHPSWALCVQLHKVLGIL